jgi:hypothetical protein
VQETLREKSLGMENNKLNVNDRQSRVKYQLNTVDKYRLGSTDLKGER